VHCIAFCGPSSANAGIQYCNTEFGDIAHTSSIDGHRIPLYHNTNTHGSVPRPRLRPAGFRSSSLACVNGFLTIAEVAAAASLRSGLSRFLVIFLSLGRRAFFPRG